ncbi:MAG: 6-hydroxycyclohex-1-ene-1-carbonyl-CoA dehydrogenase, partial [Planctomycetota bacterium]
MVPDKIKTWQMVRPWSVDKETGEKRPGLLELTEIPLGELGPDEALVEVAGCGVCHTDLGYFYHGVPTVNKPPLTLGHEISGRVVAGPSHLVGKEVIVPAVMPCGECEICKMGRENRCLKQKMPGNSLGIYGGFSSHIPVPARDLCVVEDRGDIPLEHLAVVADAVTTPYQAAKRGELKEGDRVVIIGTGGGIGVYMTQMAKAFGAAFVVGIDIDEAKLERALKFGADAVINAKQKDIKTIRDEFKSICKKNDLPHNFGWKIFECSGTKPGQELGLSLLSFVGRMVVVGFTMAKVEYQISRLMAFDAEMVGTWGCPPRHYPAVLKLVLEGKIQIEPFIEVRPMSKIREAFEEAHSGRLMRRIVLV